jgi:hypothetical protein
LAAALLLLFRIVRKSIPETIVVATTGIALSKDARLFPGDVIKRELFYRAR